MELDISWYGSGLKRKNSWGIGRGELDYFPRAHATIAPTYISKNVYNFIEYISVCCIYVMIINDLKYINENLLISNKVFNLLKFVCRYVFIIRY